MEKFRYKTVCFSNCGKIRKQNEDSYLLKQQDSALGTILFAAVADGMGGLSNGQQASQLLINNLLDWWDNVLPTFLLEKSLLADIEQSLESAISDANQQILKLHEKAGSTLSLLLLIGNHYLVKHAGDSRIYFVRRFGLEQVTRDQTWYEQEKERGTLRYCSEPVEKMQHVLTNAIGVKSEYFLESAQGELDNIKLILLCSDGVYCYCSFAVLDQLLRRYDSIEKKSRKLEMVLQQSEARDNYTAILIEKKNGGSLANIWRKN